MALMLQKKGCGGVSTLAFWYFLVQQVPGDKVCFSTSRCQEFRNAFNDLGMLCFTISDHVSVKHHSFLLKMNANMHSFLSNLQSRTSNTSAGRMF